MDLTQTFSSADAKPHIANTDCVFLEFSDTKMNKIKQWGLFIESIFFSTEAVHEYSTAKFEGIHGVEVNCCYFRYYFAEFHIDLPKQGMVIYDRKL